jgi:DNA-binding response OmpR family regulator
MFQTVTTVHASVLIYGKDPVLLETRQRILARAGFRSIAVTDFDKVIPFVQQKDVTLLVLCSSLNELESGEVLAAVDQLGRRDLKKLVLTKDIEDVVLSDKAAVLVTPAAPQEFLAVVGSVVQPASSLS